MMIRVYFERKGVGVEVATFESESHYIACLPTLKKLAKQEGWTHVTESVDEKWQEQFIMIPKEKEEA